MLPFNETKKRKRPERLNMRQKQWLCEQKKSEPTITEKNLALLFYEKFKVSISQQTVSYQLKNSEKILSSDAREPTSHMRIQNQIRYDFEKDLIVERNLQKEKKKILINTRK